MQGTKLELLPDEVTRILATQGPVNLTVGVGPEQRTTNCAIAPLDGCLFLFVPVGGYVDKALMENTGATVVARDPDGKYLVRIKGSSVAGKTAISHPRRMELIPWIPSDMSPGSTLAIPFMPEHLMYQKGSDANDRYEGVTPAGMERLPPRTAWFRLALGRFPLVPMFSFLVMLSWIGAEFTGRPLIQAMTLSLSSLCATSLFAAAHIFYMKACFTRWRVGRCLPSSTPILANGYIAPREANKLSLILLLLTAISVSLLVQWGGKIVLYTLASTLLWALVPYWLIHLSQRAPEGKASN
jgi:hypothetical protein